MQKIIRLKALILKEFLTIFKDPKNRALIIFPPIIQLVVFAQAITLEVRNIDLTVLDYSKTYNSRELISRFYNSKWFNKIYFAKKKKRITRLVCVKQSQNCFLLYP